MAAGSGGTVGGAELIALRRQLLVLIDEALPEVGREAQMTVEPGADLLVVDRRAWIAGNVRTLRDVFPELPMGGAETKLVAWEGGALLGLLARAVLAQYDPFRDALIVVQPNLGDVANPDALRWLAFHELTHLAQFRTAPWIADFIVESGRKALDPGDGDWMREAARRMAQSLPDVLRSLRQAFSGGPDAIAPIVGFLPDEQRALILRMHALLSLLEGHATYITDLIGARVFPDYERMQRRIKEGRRRSPLLRVLETVAGLEMKRQQYITGRAFCEEVWKHGGAAALAPAWSGPDNAPTHDEIRDPARWLARVSRPA